MYRVRLNFLFYVADISFLYLIIVCLTIYVILTERFVCFVLSWRKYETAI